MCRVVEFSVCETVDMFLFCISTGRAPMNLSLFSSSETLTGEFFIASEYDGHGEMRRSFSRSLMSSMRCVSSGKAVDWRRFIFGPTTSFACFGGVTSRTRLLPSVSKENFFRGVLLSYFSLNKAGGNLLRCCSSGFGSCSGCISVVWYLDQEIDVFFCWKRSRCKNSIFQVKIRKFISSYTLHTFQTSLSSLQLCKAIKDFFFKFLLLEMCDI